MFLPKKRRSLSQICPRHMSNYAKIFQICERPLVLVQKQHYIYVVRKTFVEFVDLLREINSTEHFSFVNTQNLTLGGA